MNASGPINVNPPVIARPTQYSQICFLDDFCAYLYVTVGLLLWCIDLRGSQGHFITWHQTHEHLWSYAHVQLTYFNSSPVVAQHEAFVPIIFFHYLYLINNIPTTCLKDCVILFWVLFFMFIWDDHYCFF